MIGYGCLELVLGVMDRGGDNVAHFAHIGGLVAGVILLLYWKKEEHSMGKILDSLKEQFKRKEILIQLITINVIIFLIISFLNIIKVLFKLESFNIVQYLGVSSSLEDMYQVWTWFTYMFVHESLWHILINMFVLYFSSRLFLFFSIANS